MLVGDLFVVIADDFLQSCCVLSERGRVVGKELLGFFIARFKVQHSSVGVGCFLMFLQADGGSCKPLESVDALGFSLDPLSCPMFHSIPVAQHKAFAYASGELISDELLRGVVAGAQEARPFSILD